MQTIHVHLVITTDKDVKDLPELIAGRAWTIDGVSNVEIDETKSGHWTKDVLPPLYEGAELDSQFLPEQPDEISPRWTEVL